MNHIVTTETDGSPTTTGPASYAERRAQMADETRTRILEACVAILARGVAELSIPAVAREAGVSVPTVYRNFPDKKTLVHETALFLRGKRAPMDQPVPLDDLPAQLLRNFQNASSVNETVRAALASEEIQQAKRELGENGRRRRQAETVLGKALDNVPPEGRDHAILMTMVLCSSATLRAFREVAGAGPEAAAETVIWTISRILGRPFQTPGSAAPIPAAVSKPPARAKRAKKGSR